MDLHGRERHVVVEEAGFSTTHATALAVALVPAWGVDGYIKPYVTWVGTIVAVTERADTVTYS